MINQATVYENCNKLFVNVMTFGDWLRQKIKENHFSNAEVARRVGVSPTYIGNLVRDYSPNTKSGKAKPSEEVLKNIVEVVGGDLDEARLAAGYAPKNGTSEIPEAVREAFSREGTLSENDQILIANFVEMLKKQNADTEKQIKGERKMNE